MKVKDSPEILRSLSPHAVTGRNRPAASCRALPVAIGLWWLCSSPASAGENANESTPQPSPPPTVSAQPIDPNGIFTPEQGREYWDRYITGDWGGLRTLLHNWGIDFNLDYFSETAGNLRGGKDNFSGYQKGFGQSWSYDDQDVFGLDLDFQKLIGWEGGSFEAYFTKRNGDSLSQYTNPAPIEQSGSVWTRANLAHHGAMVQTEV
jgi:hypothetical protein